MKHDVLITGATGLIGGEIAWRLMRQGRRVWCVIRSGSFADAAARLELRFSLSGQACDWSRLVALPGDILLKNFGLQASALEHLREVCSHVIHCAAETSFARDNHCQEINVDGTRNVLEVSSAFKSTLFHVSSAAVCLEPPKEKFKRGGNGSPLPRFKRSSEFGTQVIREEMAYAGYANDYVISKRRCEEILLEAPVNSVILRPSIVMSEGVSAREFARSILWVFPLIRKLGILPMFGNELIDAVSVRFVAESIVRMLNRPLKHRVYHISAGPNDSISWRELFENLTENGHDYQGVRFDPNVDWAAFGGSGRRIRKTKDAVGYYLPFMRGGVVYDRKRLEECLGKDLPECPRGSEYCAALLDQITQREALSEAARP